MEKQKLESILGQLLDLKQGTLGEIVLRNNEWTDLIRKCVAEKIERENEFLKMDAEQSLAESMKQRALERDEADANDLRIDEWKEEKIMSPKDLPDGAETTESKVQAEILNDIEPTGL